MKQTFYIGGYADTEHEGIIRIRADFDRGIMEQEAGWSGIGNPSYLLLHPGGNMLSAVHEYSPDGGLSAFRLEGEQLTEVAGLPVDGADPCHLSLDDTGHFLFVANYTSGSLAVFRLDKDGIPTEMSDHLQHTGHGTNAQRQEGPHVHFSLFHQGELYVTDLGTDEIYRYRLNEKMGRLSESGPRLRIPAGNGPRHLAFSPKDGKILYVLCEMASELCVMRRDGGDYVLVQRISTLPDGLSEAERESSTAAAIRVSADGNYLFTSNRGKDSIAIFRVEEGGVVEFLGAERTGRIPRDFLPVGRLAGTPWEESFLLVADQEDRQVEVLRWNEKAETLEPIGMTLKTGMRPSCIQPVL